MYIVDDKYVEKSKHYVFVCQTRPSTFIGPRPSTFIELTHFAYHAILSLYVDI